MGIEFENNSVRFDNRVAVVTGSGGGLGRTYAIELAKRGAKVVVNDLGGPVDGTGEGSATPADQVTEEIRALGGNAVASYDSVATFEGGRAIVNRAIETFGGVDILINNAGILHYNDFVELEPEDWDRMLSVHLNGAYNVTRPALQWMRQKNYGRIVMTTSDFALFGWQGCAHYAAAKMGHIGLINVLKQEMEGSDIKVNAIAPVAFTRMAGFSSTAPASNAALYQKFRTDYVSSIVLCLCSDQCPVTGSIYQAGMGFYRRIALIGGPGAFLAKDEAVPSPEEVFQNWESINNISGGKEYFNRHLSMENLITDA